MESVAYSTFRNNLRSYLDKTRDDASPIMVTSKDPSANVVVMNYADYENLMENLNIQSNAYLVNKLKKGMADVVQGKVVNKPIVEV